MPQKRSGGREAPSREKRSRPCAGNGAAGREEGKQHPLAETCPESREPSLKGVFIRFPAAFCLPSAWAVVFVSPSLCLDGFNVSNCCKSPDRRRGPAVDPRLSPRKELGALISKGFPLI